MKYASIYALLHKRASRVPGFHISDHSTWSRAVQNWMTRQRPLWIIVEDPSVNLRIWITQERNQLSLSCARLDADLRSQTQRDSYCSWNPPTQRALLTQLKNLFEIKEVAE